MIGIYRIYCTKDNKVYVGQSCNINYRIKEHFNELRHNRHRNSFLQNVFNKYGEENIKYEFLQECTSREELNYYETFWYEKFCNELGKENMLNLQRTGNAHNISDEMKRRLSEKHRNKKLSEEHKKKISETLKGHKNYLEHQTEETRRKISVHNARYWLGKHPSEETKRKISLSLKGKKYNLVKRRKQNETN